VGRFTSRRQEGGEGLASSSRQYAAFSCLRECEHGSRGACENNRRCIDCRTVCMGTYPVILWYKPTRFGNQHHISFVCVMQRNLKDQEERLQKKITRQETHHGRGGILKGAGHASPSAPWPAARPPSPPSLPPPPSGAAPSLRGDAMQDSVVAEGWSATGPRAQQKKASTRSGVGSARQAAGKGGSTTAHRPRGSA